MSYIAEVIGEIFYPTEAQLQRRKEAEERRRDALGWRGRLKEDARECAFHVGWGSVVILALTLLFGPWVYGAWKLFEKLT